MIKSYLSDAAQEGPEPLKCVYAPLAQVVEHHTFNVGVRSSSLRRRTKMEEIPAMLGRQKKALNVIEKHSVGS